VGQVKAEAAYALPVRYIYSICRRPPDHPSQRRAHMARNAPGQVDPTKGLSLDPEEFLQQQARREQALRMQELIRPGRTTPIAIRFDQFTLTRLKALAALRNTGYQTLLKEFVVERLYEEEKREGII
jgi:hypothetical protein